MYWNNPRPVDILMVAKTNLLDIRNTLPEAGGFAIDLQHLPPMDAEQLDGLLVALRSMAKDNVPAALVEAISRVQALHARAAHHGIDLAMARIEDGSGISEASALPMTGRSKKSTLTQAKYRLDSCLALPPAGTTSPSSWLRVLMWSVVLRQWQIPRT